MDKFPHSTKIEGFDKIRGFLSEIPNIGYGGCGVAALAMYRWLISQGFNKQYISFLMGYNRHNSYVNNSKAYADSTSLPNACSHVGLVIQYEDNDLILDCDKRLHINSYTYGQIVNDKGLLSSLNTNPDEWNDDFNRRKYIPIIENELKIDLSDVSKKRW